MSLTPYKSAPFRPEDAAHLARRTSFGATDDEIRALAALGPVRAAEQLMGFKQDLAPGNPFDPADAVSPGAAIKVMQARWLYEMVYTPYPLREKLALTWHNHFVVGTDKVKNVIALGWYLDLLRGRSLGKFADFAVEMAKTPAMLHYLDNADNKKGKPNENFSRELMELFTTGIGHYTEKDVTEGARALTGWSFQGGRGKDHYFDPPKFVFNAKQHDGGPKTYLGKSGNFGPEEVVRLAAAHPATGDFIARKLLRAFVTDQPKAADVKALGDVFRATGGDLRQVMATLLTSQLFYAPENRAAIIKSPAEFVVGALRALGRPKLEDKQLMNLTGVMARMGQELLKPPNVKGWDGGREWINDTTLLLRMQVAAGLALGKGAPKGLKAGPLALLGSERTLLRAALDGLNPSQQTYLQLISPEYALA